MKKISIQGLLELLKSKQFDALLQEETNQIYVILKLIEREFPLFFRIMDDGSLLQLLVFMPCKISDKTVADLGRLLHLLNKELDIPGFGMDEQAGVVFYRCMIPTVDQELAESVLDGFLNSIQTVCSTFSPAVEAVASGAASFEELLKKAEEHSQQSGGGPAASK